MVSAASQKAIALIRPLADTGEDIAQLRLARWLAECDQAGELRQRADAGDDDAGTSRRLAGSTWPTD